MFLQLTGIGLVFLKIHLHMSNATYSEKLQNPLWQRKRLEILNRDNFTCQLCQDKGTTLHIHHKEYIKGNQPWEYADDNFQTLCKYCHAVVEYLKDSKCMVISMSRSFSSEWACYFVQAVSLSEIGLGIMIFRQYDNGVIEHVINFKKKTLEGFVEILQATEKLISKTNG